MTPRSAGGSDEAQHAGPAFADQGIGIDEVLFELGLLSEPFYDGLAPADPTEVAALEALWGAPLPAEYRAFLEATGGSLGPLRIVDWRTPWEFRPGPLLAHLRERAAADVDDLWRRGLLPIARQGETTELGYTHEACLLLDTATGEIASEDPNRDSYEDLAALLLEWGHRVLDPNMAVKVDRMRAWSDDRLPPGRIREIHELAASQQADGARFVGRWLGVYRFQRSGLIVRLDGPGQLWVEAYVARRVDPQRTAAGAVLREGIANGWLRS